MIVIVYRFSGLIESMATNINQSHESGSDNRKSARYRLTIPAIVFHDGIQILSAEIEDFCQNGLFLVVKDQQIPASLSQGDKITIQFSTGYTKDASTCSLDAEIVRMSENGVGVHLSNQSPKVIAALTALSKQQHSSNDTLNNDGLVDKRETTKLALEVISSKLPVLAEQCLDECYELISNRMSAPESNHFANRYFEALSELKTKKLKLIDEFLNAQANALDKDNHVPPPEQSTVANSLSLVDESEFEDWLAIQEMSKRIERRHEELLTQLSSQITQMMTVEDPQHDNIIAPMVLSSSFNTALCALSFDGSMRVLIYPGLEEGLQIHLGQFYQQLSLEFNEHGIHPIDNNGRVVRMPRQNQSTGSVVQSSDQLIESHVAGIENTNQAQSVLPPGNISELNSLANLLQSMQMLSPVAGQGNSLLPAQPSVKAENIDDVRKIVTHLAPTTGNTNQDAVEVLQEQIMQALLKQQGDQQVVDQQKTASLAATTQIFDALNAQANTQASTQAYIQQLQLPFLHHALTQPDGGDGNADVVQHIIDLLDQVISLIGDSNKAWAVEAKASISEMVQSIVSESVARPEIFKDVEAELEGYADKALSNRNHAEKKLIDTCEGQQRVRKSKRLINEVLDDYLGDKTVPAIVPRLLKSGWKQILVRTELRDGLGSDQWLRMIGVIKHLIDWLTEPEAIKSVSEDQIQELLNLVNQQLSETSLDSEKQKNIIGKLVSLLLGSGTPRVIRPSKLVTIKSKKADDLDQEPADSKFLWVDELKVGDWFEFITGKQSQEQLKLIWLGSEPWHSVFVNQRGVKRFEFTRPQLIKHYQSKLVSKIESPDQPIATRAKHAVVERYYSDVRHTSLEDSRVGLPNSKGLLAYLRETNFEAEATLIIVEVDDYRVISQACGMEASDDVIKEVGKRMQQHSSNNAMLARIDDQSLAMVLPDTSVDSFYRMASGWSEGLRNEPFKHGSQSFPLILSIGLIGFTQDNLLVDQLVKNVAVACASAKQSGRNHIKVYSDNDRQLQQRAEQLEWAGHIDKTLAENRLVLACQPIVPLKGNASGENDLSGSHYEILLRVLDAKGRIGPPGSFLSAGEQLRRMPDIDRWVIKNLMQWMQDNIDLVNLLDGFSVNLSGQSVASESFLKFVTEQVFEVNFDPSKLTFEITETVAIDDFDYVKKFIQHMKKLGCKFSLDDFGSGYASYSYLRNLDVDYLKIDGIFVKDLHKESKDLMMVRSMNDIAHSLGLKTIAEFVENKEILSLLGEIGVDYAQGYHLGKPAPVSELVKMFEANQSVTA